MPPHRDGAKDRSPATLARCRGDGEELRGLADRKDVPGFVDLTFPWGPQPSLIDEGKGALTVGWVMHTQQLATSW